MRRGVGGVTGAVAGDLPHDESLEHLGEGTLPDFPQPEVLAALNGLAAATGSGRGSRHPQGV